MRQRKKMARKCVNFRSNVLRILVVLSAQEERKSHIPKEDAFSYLRATVFLDIVPVSRSREYASASMS
jgi:hypothetical protein